MVNFWSIFCLYLYYLLRSTILYIEVATLTKIFVRRAIVEEVHVVSVGVGLEEGGRHHVPVGHAPLGAGHAPVQTGIVVRCERIIGGCGYHGWGSTAPSV